MYYCFVKEDLEIMEEKDPLMIQAAYAKALGKFLCLEIEHSCVTDQHGNEQSINGQTVFLRTTCWNLDEANKILVKLGANLIETNADVKRIENWTSLELTKRKIFSVRYKDILEHSFSEEVKVYLTQIPRVFMKSKSKGYCVKIPSHRLINPDEEVMSFFENFKNDNHEELLMTEELQMKSDSLGNKESRHVVLNGRIINSSRALHSLKHAVPKTLLLKAEEIVSQIAKIESFPQNYILDIGMFEKDGDIFADIVEMNPLAVSLCYVNNSVFEEDILEIKTLKKKWNMGAEYCFDMLTHPDNYVETRRFGENYSYLNEGHYELR